MDFENANESFEWVDVFDGNSNQPVTSSTDYKDNARIVSFDPTEEILNDY